MTTTMRDDYFAEGLLEKLDNVDPVGAAYEAQDVSAGVGFDFDSFEDVVPRALDEVRETLEAYEEIDSKGLEPFGDEVADLIFSFINLSRHAGISDLPTMDQLVEATPSLTEVEIEQFDTMQRVRVIGAKITEVADKFDQSDKSAATVLELLITGSAEAIQIAQYHELDPTALLRENVRKYLVRCRIIEEIAAEDGKTWRTLADNEEIVDYWKRAKNRLKG